MVIKDFIKKVADTAEVPQSEAKKVIDAFNTVMMEDIFAAEDSVRLAIGTFSGYTRETSERTGRNPQTGETLVIPAKVMKGYPKFKPSKAAKL